VAGVHALGPERSAGAPFAKSTGVTSDWGADRPTFDEVLAQIRQDWEDIGHVITYVQRALGQLPSIHEQTDRSGGEVATDPGIAEAA
jgi:hypothetical protein